MRSGRAIGLCGMAVVVSACGDETPAGCRNTVTEVVFLVVTDDHVNQRTWTFIINGEEISRVCENDTGSDGYQPRRGTMCYSTDEARVEPEDFGFNSYEDHLVVEARTEIRGEEISSGSIDVSMPPPNVEVGCSPGYGDTLVVRLGDADGGVE